MIPMLLFRKEWKILISILELVAVYHVIDASILEREKGFN